MKSAGSSAAVWRGRRCTAGVLLVGCWLLSCTQASTPEREALFDPTPTRGLVLISLDTLRADYLGAYGQPAPTSPFLDSLTSRATVFEHAVAPYPATLVSHMSMFTGLYPRQHGVYPPNFRLSEAIGTLPEWLQAAGFRTAGYTEGGFVAGGYGFGRGFEIYEDPAHVSDTDIEKTFARGVEFLAGLGADERFFLFLHTYSVHDPYDPPGELAPVFAPHDPSAAEGSRGERLRDVNLGFTDVTEEEVDDFRRLYGGSVRYVDEVLRQFFGDLNQLGLAQDTTVVVTSDHGEEFLEHGRVAHTQLYPESIFVPLVVVHPGQPRGARVSDVVQLVDLPLTLLELLGVSAPDGLSGNSLVEYLRFPSERRADGFGYAEVRDQETNRTLLRWYEGELFQFHLVQPLADPEGVWVSRSVTFDTSEPLLKFRSRSFHRPRNVEVLLDGDVLRQIELGTDWQEVTVEFPPGRGRYRVTLRTGACDSPRELGLGEDGRCLSFIAQGPELFRTELFNLTRDPTASQDVSLDHPQLHRRMARQLADLAWTPVASAESEALEEEQRETLRALGYLD